nr:diacylglycerol O-acyltransferase 2D-like [Tanacetum cinerariifolium]
MNHDFEVGFVKARKGFIRQAMETDSPVVSVFAFGQSYAYKWWKPRGQGLTVADDVVEAKEKMQIAASLSKTEKNVAGCFVQDLCGIVIGWL